MEEEKKTEDPGHDEGAGETAKDGRSRTWMFLLYPDNEEHKAVLDGKKFADLDWNYAGRVHDMEGKEHHHVVVLFKDGRKAADVAADVGLTARWVRPFDRQKRALRYLCHRDNPEKYQYSTDGIYGTIAEKAVAACSKGNELSEAQSVQEIIKLLDEIDGFVSYSFFMNLVAERGYFSIFRRLGVLGVRLIDEHNARCRNELEQTIAQQNDTEKFEKFCMMVKALPFNQWAEMFDRYFKEHRPKDAL